MRGGGGEVNEWHVARRLRRGDDGLLDAESCSSSLKFGVTGTLWALPNNRNTLAQDTLPASLLLRAIRERATVHEEPASHRAASHEITARSLIYSADAAAAFFCASRIFSFAVAATLPATSRIGAPSASSAARSSAVFTIGSVPSGRRT